MSTTIQLNVTQTREEIAEQQIRAQEKRRLFGVVPNHYVSYVPDAVPLSTPQKFQLGWKFAVKPFAFSAWRVSLPGIQQANNSFSGRGQEAQGYVETPRRNLSPLLKQDPRYFCQGSGSKKSRFFYAAAKCRHLQGR